ncbi:hypothetical protein SUDANB1_05230 [Streptomyces sp. enrichment culture]|uniref:hypothetical protein n=1 Tax=Streptomyces sp. enrichment culture TaxID=1795815 RepID=UPI003F54D149
MLRRILPQFTRGLVAGQAEPLFGLEEAGYSFARGRWERWPDDHADPVREFLHAWWEQSLTDPDAAVLAYQVFAMCAEASGTLGPWIADWERLVRRTSAGCPDGVEQRHETPWRGDPLWGVFAGRRWRPRQDSNLRPSA